MKIKREIVRHANASMHYMQFTLSAFRGTLHRHDAAELTLVERGSGLRWVGDVVAPFEAGDVVLIGANVPHVWLSPPGVATGGCATTVVQFPAHWPASTQIPEMQALSDVLALAMQGLCIEGQTRTAVRRLLLDMAHASAPRRVGMLIEALCLVHEGLLGGAPDVRCLSQRMLEPTADARVAAARGKRVDRLCQWIQAHLGEELRVPDAASLVGVSPAAFARFFRREVGKSFVHFVNDARCSWAAVRLLKSDDAIATIALDCGFATLSNFGQQFRRRYGVSPRTYRREGPQVTGASLRLTPE